MAKPKARAHAMHTTHARFEALTRAHAAGNELEYELTLQ